MTGPRRFVTVVLALVAAALVLAVVVKYWPPEVERLAGDAIGWLRDLLLDAWRRVGGRWVALGLAVLGTGLGLVVLRHRRWAGLLIIEVSVAAAAILALLQPDGW